MSSKQTFCCLFKFTNVFPAYFFESLNIVLIKCCYSVDFFSFRYLSNNFTMFTLKTIVDLFFLVYKRHQLYSSSDLNNIFTIISLTLDTALPGFSIETIILYLSLSIIDLIMSFFTSSLLFFVLPL